MWNDKTHLIVSFSLKAYKRIPYIYHDKESTKKELKTAIRQLFAKQYTFRSTMNFVSKMWLNSSIHAIAGKFYV